MTDAYEREHMPGIGAVLHRQKATVPRWAVGLAVGLPLVMSAFLASTLVAAGSVMVASLVAGAALVASVVVGAAMITFASARLVVSEGELAVQLGFAGPRVAIGDVARVFIGPSGTNKNGIGIRRALGGKTWVFMWGDNARAVHVERKDGTRLVLVTKETDALHAALEEALARRDGAAPRVRIADPSDVDAVLEAEEAEAHLKASAKVDRIG